MAVEKILDGRLKLERGSENDYDLIFCEHLSDGSVRKLEEMALKIGDRIVLILCARCSAMNQISVLKKWLLPEKDVDERITEARRQIEVLERIVDGS